MKAREIKKFDLGPKTSAGQNFSLNSENQTQGTREALNHFPILNKHTKNYFDFQSGPLGK